MQSKSPSGFALFLGVFFIFVSVPFLMKRTDHPVEQATQIKTPETVQPKSAPIEAIYPVERFVKYTFTLHNESNDLLKDVEFSAVAPVSKTSNQKVNKVDATYPFTLQADDLGNQFLNFAFEYIEPFGTKIITVEAKVAFANMPNIDDSFGDLFLGPEKSIETNDQALIDQAQKLKAETDWQTAETIFSWTSQYIKYDGFIAKELGAKQALVTKRGDCSEYSSLSTALARINGIPARVMAGFIVESDGNLKARDFHNWTEVYIDNKWHILDAQEKYFNQHGAQYLATRIVNGKSSDVLNGSQRYKVSTEKIKVTME